MDGRQDGPPRQDPGRRSSLAAKVVGGLTGVGEAIARTAGTAAALLTEQDLRQRGAQMIQGGIQGGMRGLHHGIQTGLQTVQQGPRQLQSVLQRLTQQIEQQRMEILLREERDAPVDVQVGFQLFEDAPQDLRSRLWMALLQHPELVRRYTEIVRAEAEQHVPNPQEAAAPQEQWAEGRPRTQSTPSTPPVAAPQSPGAQQRDGSEGGSAAGRLASPLVPSADDAGWELVSDAGSRRRQGQHLLASGSFNQRQPFSPARDAYRNELMAAMNAVLWPLPSEHPSECRYATLLQISVGQEEVDEDIARDIHRTFPEHALFAFEQGQQALFRVLKAYSLHDLEANYCQGMAFLAGLLLFFVNEEPAFQIFCRLLREDGPNLRRLYLPGLEGLKAELRRLDWLMERHLPNLRLHLEGRGAVPVLYASQWFLTAFSCPFPVSFACRLVDIMLATGSEGIMQRVAMAVLAECEGELLVREDFEELLTYLKVEPVQWSPHRLRRVLNAAANSPITDAELAEATAAVAEDPHSLLAGLDAVTGSTEEEGAALGDPSLAGIEGAVGGLDGAVLGQLSAHASPQKGSRASNLGEAAGRGTSGTEPAGVGAAGCSDDLDVELQRQRSELDTAYVQMVLDLDQMWSGEGEEEEAGDVYEHALTGTEAQEAARADSGAGGGQQGVSETSTNRRPEEESPE